MRQYLLLGAALCLVSGPVIAAEYAIQYEDSSVTFSGEHAGNTFTGTVGEWEGQITFDPEHLEEASVSAVFQLESFKTGSKMYDGTLPKSDWFKVKDFPTGNFVSTSFAANEDGSYKVTGDLTLRDITHPISFDFTLSDLLQEPVTMTAAFPIDRLAYDIGRGSDAEAEWVSQNITMNLQVVASPLQEDGAAPSSEE